MLWILIYEGSLAVTSDLAEIQDDNIGFDNVVYLLNFPCCANKIWGSNSISCVLPISFDFLCQLHYACNMVILYSLLLLCNLWYTNPRRTDGILTSFCSVKYHEESTCWANHMYAKQGFENAVHMMHLKLSQVYTSFHTISNWFDLIKDRTFL